MTINLADNTPRISYTVAQGVTQTSFAVPFEFFDNGDLKVYVDGTLKTITTHYTVSGGNGSTGTVAISVTGATGGSTVIITRDIPLARTTDFPTSGAFAVATLNRELDRFTAMQADRADESDRSIKLKDQDSTSSMELPLLADRKGKYLRFAASDGDIEPVDQAVDTGGIATSMLADNAVTTAKINASAVTTAKINAAAVTTAKIADTAVTGAKINTDAISAQTALTSGLAATDELLVSDAGTIKRMDVSVLTDHYKDLSVTETNKTLTSAVLNSTISGTSIKDEDDMSSNSASHLATQQSIKAYVDATVTAEDLDLTTDSGSIAIDLDSETLTIAGGEGIDTSATSNTVTITAEAATTSNLGVASFSGDNFAVSSGAVTIKDGGVVTAELAADAVTAAKIADNAISEEHLDPSIISGLADTSIASADHLMFLDATDGALKKVDAGELGVGTALTSVAADTTPQLGGDLDVNGNEITSASNGNIVVNPNGSGAISLSAATTADSLTVTGDLTVDTNTLFVDASENAVGIGTASPAGQLHIKGSDVTNQVIIENTDDGSGVAPDLTLRRTSASPADGDGIGEVIFQSLNDNSENLTMADIRGLITDVSDGTEDGALTFRTREAGSLGERMRIDGSNVGINTTSPASKLHIQDTGGSTVDAITLDWEHSTTTADIEQRIQWRFGDDATAGSFLESGYVAMGKENQWNVGANRDSYLSFATTSNGTQGERVRIDSSGNVGIGTTTVSEVLHLHRASGTCAEKFTDSTTGTGAGDGFEIGKDSSQRGFIWNYENTDTYFATNNTTRMTIASSGAVSIVGSISKGSGSFKIDHPLDSKSKTHHLVHSFVEAPQADNIYRGTVDLVDGSATVNIDTVAGMTDGTFVALNREIQCFTSNETGWTAIKGSVSGNTLTITAQENTCTDTISWLVVGERKDAHMYDTDWTDDNGKVIVEPLKPDDTDDATPFFDDDTDDAPQISEDSDD